MIHPDSPFPRVAFLITQYNFMASVVIFDIKRFAVHDGPGIRTTVFLKGCPLRCWWCHNPESQAGEPFTVEVDRMVDGRKVAGKKTYGEKIEVADLMEILMRDRHFYEESGGGITFSGGEPLMQIEGLAELLESAKKHGLHTAVDTCGFAKRAHFERIFAHTDLFLYDLKHMDPRLHEEYTGVDNGLILSNAQFLLENGADLIFRIPVIPGINTSDSQVSGMVGFLEERQEYMKEVHLLPYHRIADNKYLRLRMKNQLPEVHEPDLIFMERLKVKFEKSGLKVVLGG